MKKITFSILFLMTVMFLNAQNFMQGGNVQGNFQVDVQTYEPNNQIGITADDIDGKKLAMNGFGNIIYTNKNFTAGLRYEAFLPQMAGYVTDLEGNGIANRFISYKKEKFEITLGNFYEQFGNGLILRTFEEWSLGYDNALDGARVKLNLIPGVSIKGIYGVQRKFWETYEPNNRGIVKGVDGDFFLNEMIPFLKNNKTNIFLGTSLVSRYQKEDSYSPFKQPENVSAYAGRFSVNRGGFNLQGEYAHKINDPSAFNGNIYKAGEAGFLSASYSQKGIGFTLSSKYLDNMGFKSDRAYLGNALDIGFQPPLTKTHSYGLEAMYPYSTQLNGEFSISGKLIFRVPKKSLIGGKYGMGIEINYSRISSIKKEKLNDYTPIGKSGTLGYTAPLFMPGDLLYFQDINTEIHKKFNRKWKGIFAYTYLIYNNDVVREDIQSDENIYNVSIATADITYKFTRKIALRSEFQYLMTKDDKGDWVSALFELTLAPKWFFMLKDEWNIPNNKHFYAGAFGYTYGSTKLQLGYGLQREGITCVGGICRYVPQTSGLTISIFSTF